MWRRKKGAQVRGIRVVQLMKRKKRVQVWRRNNRVQLRRTV